MMTDSPPYGHLDRDWPGDFTRGSRDQPRPAAPIEHLVEHYRLIGETLSACEAASFLIGIPWLPATERVKNLRKEVDGFVEDFVRMNLVAVHTNTLESYCEDLEQSSQGKPTTTDLGLHPLTLSERYGFTVLSGTLVFVFTFINATFLTGSVPAAFLAGLLSATIISALAFSISADKFRFHSFLWVIRKEIMRRLGINNSGISQLRFPTMLRPLSQ